MGLIGMTVSCSTIVCSNSSLDFPTIASILVKYHFIALLSLHLIQCNTGSWTVVLSFFLQILTDVSEVYDEPCNQRKIFLL